MVGLVQDSIDVNCFDSPLDDTISQQLKTILGPKGGVIQKKTEVVAGVPNVMNNLLRYQMNEQKYCETVKTTAKIDNGSSADN